MMKLLYLVSCAAALSGASIVMVHRLTSEKPADSPRFSPEARGARKLLGDGATLYGHGHLDQAEHELQAVVDSYRKSQDPDAQDAVAKARLTIGYIKAQDGDWKGARQTFVEASQEYRGTNTIAPGFGTLGDQAEYQAAVAAAKSESKAASIALLVDFLKRRKTSPLVYGAHNRLLTLDPSRQPAYDQLLQEAVTEQEHQAKVLTARCGPLVVTEYLRSTGRNGTTVDESARLCRSGENGTTMEGMQNGFASLGVALAGYETNRRDFAGLDTPFVWLMNEHYVLVREVGPTSALVYDPMQNGDNEIKLSPLDDVKFRAIVLARKGSIKENK